MNWKTSKELRTAYIEDTPLKNFCKNVMGWQEGKQGACAAAGEVASKFALVKKLAAKACKQRLVWDEIIRKEEENEEEGMDKEVEV